MYNMFFLKKIYWETFILLKDISRLQICVCVKRFFFTKNKTKPRICNNLGTFFFNQKLLNFFVYQKSFEFFFLKKYRVKKCKRVFFF